MSTVAKAAPMTPDDVDHPGKYITAKTEITIMDALAGGAHYLSVIAHRTGLNERTIRRVLNSLEEDGLVTNTLEKKGWTRVKRWELLPA